MESAPSTSRGLWLLLGGTAAAAAGYWITSRAGEAAADERTRARLQPRAVLASGPSAADIKVG